MRAELTVCQSEWDHRTVLAIYALCSIYSLFMCTVLAIYALCSIYSLFMCTVLAIYALCSIYSLFMCTVLAIYALCSIYSLFMCTVLAIYALCSIYSLLNVHCFRYYFWRIWKLSTHCFRRCLVILFSDWLPHKTVRQCKSAKTVSFKILFSEQWKHLCCGLINHFVGW